MKKLLISLLLTLSLLTPGLALSGSAAAVDVFQPCNNLKAGNVPDVCKEVNNQDTHKSESPILHGLKTTINIISLIVGIAAVIVLIVSGLRMIMANGDPKQVTTARDGIIYSIIGLLVTGLAQLIVAFVLNRIG